VPQLSTDVFRLSMANEKKKEQQDDDGANSTISDGSISGSNEVFTIVSPPPRKRSSTPSNTASTTSTTGCSGGSTPGRDAIRTNLMQSHMQSLEKIQIEAAQQRKKKDGRDQQLTLTVELKTVEELLVMKKNELRVDKSRSCVKNRGLSRL
jgi:hypothetical protein